ncbi:Brix-domain-containing protein [Lentinula guzmanii]|uniref:Ribosome production factor 2 homolog n=1 Tax=Lentinula guzmanii TaxID=2804957 RepID=A0AA38JPB8_9AGAR|nr:Brix-domain-containing protein [Lentinula guzmanii]KAJ3803195.1 Brix-domain-containing protein [Lentinula aff. detonsa]
MLRTVKPKNARSKRVLDAREPKEVEDARIAIFVKGTKTGEVLNGVMKDMMALKRPDAISFSKKNVIHPLDAQNTASASSSTSSLEFWSSKNDASMFVIGQTSKKRPNDLTFVRMYDGKVLDIVEVGVENYVSMESIPGTKSTPGHKPLMHFASELFDTHPRFIQLKSMLMSLFNGEAVESIYLKGLEHVISVSLAPTPATLNTASASTESTTPLPKVHIRTYATRLLASGSRIPRVELTLMGPSMDLVLRRHTNPDPELLKQSMKRPKLKKTDIEKGLGKKRKNLDVDEMGNLRGRVHVGKQDLSKLQTRKMKGLKAGAFEDEHGDDAGDDDGDSDQEVSTKRQKLH